jgi:hypothetical protein
MPITLASYTTFFMLIMMAVWTRMVMSIITAKKHPSGCVFSYRQKRHIWSCPQYAYIDHYVHAHFHGRKTPLAMPFILAFRTPLAMPIIMRQKTPLPMPIILGP